MDKSERFKQAATRRVNNIIKQIKVLSNLSNTAVYDYEQHEVEKIFGCLNKKLREAKGKFVLRGNTFDL